MSKNFVKCNTKPIDGTTIGEFESVIISDSLCLPDGSATDPSLKFTDDPDTGLYKVSSNKIGFTAGGVDRMNISTTAVTTSNRVSIADGTQANPGLYFGLENGSGLYHSATNEIAFSMDGNKTLYTDPFIVYSDVPVSFNDGSDSTSKTSGALFVAGGIGIGGDSYIQDAKLTIHTTDPNGFIVQDTNAVDVFRVDTTNQDVYINDRLRIEYTGAAQLLLARSNGAYFFNMFIDSNDALRLQNTSGGAFMYLENNMSAGGTGGVVVRPAGPTTLVTNFQVDVGDGAVGFDNIFTVQEDKVEILMDSATALDVQTAAGSSIFSVDTTNRFLTLHTPSGSLATPIESFIYLDTAKSTFIKIRDRSSDWFNQIIMEAGATGTFVLHGNGFCEVDQSAFTVTKNSSSTFLVRKEAGGLTDILTVDTTNEIVTINNQLNIEYNAGVSQLSFQNSVASYTADMYVNSNTDFVIENLSGNREIILQTNNGPGNSGVSVRPTLTTETETRFAVRVGDGVSAYLDLFKVEEDAVRIRMDSTNALAVNTKFNVPVFNVDAVSKEVTFGASVKIFVDDTGGDAICGTATLSSGTVTVNTTAIESPSRVFVSYAFTSDPGILNVDPGNITTEVSFVIDSSNASDASTVNWFIISS